MTRSRIADAARPRGDRRRRDDRDRPLGLAKFYLEDVLPNALGPTELASLPELGRPVPALADAIDLRYRRGDDEGRWILQPHQLREAMRLHALTPSWWPAGRHPAWDFVSQNTAYRLVITINEERLHYHPPVHERAMSHLKDRHPLAGGASRALTVDQHQRCVGAQDQALMDRLPDGFSFAGILLHGRTPGTVVSAKSLACRLRDRSPAHTPTDRPLARPASADPQTVNVNDLFEASGRRFPPYVDTRRMAALVEADALVLRGLGRERQRAPGVVASTLNNLVTTRYNGALHTVITTPLAPDDLGIYGRSLWRLLTGEFLLLDAAAHCATAPLRVGGQSLS